MADRTPEASFESLLPVSQPQHSLGYDLRVNLYIFSIEARGTLIGSGFGNGCS